MSTNRPVISTQKNPKENQLHGSHDFPVDIHMDYFPLSERLSYHRKGNGSIAYHHLSPCLYLWYRVQCPFSKICKTSAR